MSSALASALLLAGASGALAQSAPVYQFDIPAEKLGQALKDFSAASSQQIVFSDDVVGERSAPALRGSYTRDQALALLLQGTDLRADVSRSGVLMVRSKNVEAASNEAGGTNDVETVVVTGTHLRDANAQSSPITVLDRGTLQAQGTNTLQGALAALPSNFEGDINVEAVNQAGGLGNSQQNRGGASSANIHALGASSTLTVLDGNHLPMGSQGVSVDISMIPVIAIDRIDVLRDGASPIYGADAVAGVVNIVTRRDFDGAETTARYGQATSGGLDQVQLAQAFGKTFDGGSFFTAYQYDDNTAIKASDREATAALSTGPATAYPSGRAHSGYANVYFDIVPDTELFAEALYTDRLLVATSSAGYGAVVDRAARENRQFVGNAGFNAALEGDWHVKGVGQFAFNSLDDAVTRSDHSEQYQIPYRETDYAANITADGSLFDVPAGAVKAAFGLDYRAETGVSNGSPIGIGSYRLSRTIYAAFGELAIPLLSSAQHIPFVQSLELSAAARYDHYSDFGGTTNPKIGVVWQVDSVLKFRGNYSTSFRAPSFAELNQVEAYYIGVTVPDPAVPSGMSNIIDLGGGNPDLKPEKARSLSFGADLVTGSFFGFQAHVEYFDVDFTDRISSPDPAAEVYGGLNYPPIQPFLTRNPSPAYVASLTSSPKYYPFYSMAFDPSTVVVVDDRLTNLASNKVSGFDFNTSINPDIGDAGALQVTLEGTYFTKFDISVQKGAPEIDEAGTVFFPPSYRLRGGALYSYGPWRANAFINYTDSFKDGRFVPTVDVSSLTTVDLVLAYKIETGSGLLSNTTIGVVANNLFDQSPPFVRATVGQGYPTYDPTNASIVGRTLAIQFQKNW
ncbi:MAG: TonB-dependent receptor [Rhizomicrobium sp.]